MPTRDSLKKTPWQTVTDYMAIYLDGGTLEKLSSALVDAEQGTDDPLDDIRLLRLAIGAQTLGAVLEQRVKDRLYEQMVGVVDDRTREGLGIKATCIPPSTPKTVTTPAYYEPNLEALEEVVPPHEYPALWTHIPRSVETKGGSKGTIRVELTE